MNKRTFTSVFIYLLLSIACLIYPQTNFEGKLKIQISEQGTKHTMDYMVKGEKFRIEMKDTDEAAAIIFDQKLKKMLVVMTDQKMYIEMALDNIETESFFENNSTGSDITKTGETKVIHGFECEKWIIKEEGLTTEAWITSKLGGFFFSGNPMNEGGPDWTSKLSDQTFFPMLAKVFKSGKQINTFEVLEVTPQKLDISLFSAPSGFQKFEMPSFNMNKDN